MKIFLVIKKNEAPSDHIHDNPLGVYRRLYIDKYLCENTQF